VKALIAPDTDSRGPLAELFLEAARKYRLDVCITLVLFATAALLTGRAWRFAYDVEEFYFGLMHLTFVQKLSFGDIHSPLPLLLFTELRQLGFDDPTIRLVSLAASGIALALIQLLTFALLEKRGELPLHVRFLAIVLFALTPLSLGMGDSIRWYPLFAFAISVFLTFYLAGGNKYWRLAAGAVLGVAASIDFLAIFVALPFAIYRYGLERAFLFRFDAVFWGLAAVFGSAGLWSAYGVATHAPLYTLGNVQFTNSRPSAIAQDILGFFGGNVVGVGEAWVLIPAVVITVVAGILLIDRRHRAAPVHLFLLMLCTPITMALAGFAEPRVFIYLAPIAVALQILFLRRQDVNLVLICGAALLAAELGTATNLYHTSAPFKRESSIPHASVIDFVKGNQEGAALVVTTDQVLADVLVQDPHAASCTSLLFENHSCFEASRHYDTIFLLYGYSAISDVHQNIYLTSGPWPLDRTRLLPNALTVGLGSKPGAKAQSVAADQLAAWLGSSKPAARVHFGEDADAKMKSRLTHTNLDPYLLTADFFSLSTTDFKGTRP
jgi:hypothetical protein